MRSSEGKSENTIGVTNRHICVFFVCYCFSATPAMAGLVFSVGSVFDDIETESPRPAGKSPTSISGLMEGGQASIGLVLRGFELDVTYAKLHGLTDYVGYTTLTDDVHHTSVSQIYDKKALNIGLPVFLTDRLHLLAGIGAFRQRYDIRSNSGVIGFEELYRWQERYLGLNFRLLQTANWEMSFGGSYFWAIEPSVKTIYRGVFDSVEQEPDESTGYRISVSLDYTGLKPAIFRFGMNYKALEFNGGGGAPLTALGFDSGISVPDVDVKTEQKIYSIVMMLRF